MDKIAARALVDEIAKTDEHSFELRTRAYLEKAWEPLGYPSWDALCQAEFPRYKLTPEQRREEVAAYQAAGLSTRATASALGVSKNTVTEDRQVSQTGTPANPAPPRKVVGQDGKTYKPRTRKAPTRLTAPAAAPTAPTAAPAAPTPAPTTPTPAPALDKQAEEGKRLLDEARALGKVRERYEPIGETELARQENMARGTVRARLALLNLPPQVQTLVETGKLQVKIGELIGRSAITEEHMGGLAHKIVAGKAGANRAEIEQTIRDFASWRYDLRSAFSTEPDLDYAGAVEREKETDRLARERRAVEAAINSREKSATKDMLRNARQLYLSLVEIRNNWERVAATPDRQQQFAVLMHDVMSVAGEILALAGENNPVPAVKPVVIDSEPSSPPNLRVIEGEVV